MSVMTSWTLSDGVKCRMEALGVDALEIFAVLNKPDAVRISQNGGRRFSAYGLAVVVKGATVEDVFLEGATADNWEECARQRALLRVSLQMPPLPVSQLMPADTFPESRTNWFPGKFPRSVPVPVTPVRVSHVLDAVHPALRAEITRQVDGDFSRLVVHSPTKVSIIPRAD